MDSFIFNEYTKRMLNGEVNSSQIWNFLPVNKNFVETLENCSSINYKQFRTTSDIGIYSADELTDPRLKYLNNVANDNNYTFYDVVNNLSGLVNATYSTVKYRKDSNTINKPLYIDNSVDEEELKNLYGIELNDTHRYYKNSGFYFVTRASELNWLANRCKNNNTFTICLGDNISNENLYEPIGTDEKNYQGIFDGAGFVFSSCNITVNKDINGVIGVLGENGVVKNVRIKDLTFSSDNALNLNYMSKYNNDINVGFVAKNYGKVFDVSSIGDNYVYGLSPSVYSVYNKTDSKGDADNEFPYTYTTAYFLDESDLDYREYHFRREYKNVHFYDCINDSSCDVKSIIMIDKNNKTYTLNNTNYLLAMYEGNNISRISISDYLKDDNGNYFEYIKTRPGSIDLKEYISKADNYRNIINHDWGGYNIFTFNGSTNDLEKSFKTNRYYREYNGKVRDLTYCKVTALKCDANGNLSAYINEPIHKNTDTTNKDREFILNHLDSGSNIYYVNSSQKEMNYGSCYDNIERYVENIHPYIGYYHTNEHTVNLCEGYSNQLKFTYLTSPIVGSNFNYISGCLNNSRIYFGIDKYNNLNQFVGEYGCIAGYNEGIVSKNISNSEIMYYNRNNCNNQSKIFMKFTYNENNEMDSELLKSMYNEQLDKKNYLIFGNIVGRNNLYSHNSRINDNESNLIIDKDSHNLYNNDYCRMSTLVGSMYLNTLFSSVSSYNSEVYNNSSKIDNKDSSYISATNYFNELMLIFDEGSNVCHYTNSYSSPHYTDETDKNRLNLYRNEINEIIKKSLNNSVTGTSYKNFKVEIPSDVCYIGENFSYIKPDNHLKICKYETLNSTTTSLTYNTMNFSNEDKYVIDNFFDIRALLTREDYTAVNLPVLSAKVEFDYNDINFKIVESENNLCWGTSADIKEELKTKGELDGYVINSKDFAGVIIYDNDGNLVGYENNYNTNVLYTIYSMNYNNNIIMEIK